MERNIELTEYELNTPSVIKIITYLEDSLAAYRVMNDSPNADPLLKGRIAEIKRTLKKIKPTADKAVGVNHPTLRKY
jgi:hypothetical protein